MNEMLTFIVVDSFSPSDLYDYFESKARNDQLTIWSKSHSSSNDPGLRDVMEQLRKTILPPNNFGRSIALEVASKYIRDPEFRDAVDVKDLKDMMSAWVWAYPDEADLQFVLGEIESRFGNYYLAALIFDGVCGMEIFSEMEQHTYRKKLDSWVSEIANTLEYWTTGTTVSTLEMEWELPSLLAQDSTDSLDIGSLVALTEMKTAEGTDTTEALVELKESKDVKAIVHVDLVDDFAAKKWGTLGTAVLEVIQYFLVSLTEYPDETFEMGLTPPRAWPFAECKFVANRSVLAISAICPISMWSNVKECLFWLVNALGQPNDDGLYRKGLLTNVPNLDGIENISQITTSEELGSAIGRNDVAIKAMEELKNLKISVSKFSALLPRPVHEVVLREIRPQDALPVVEHPYDLCWNSLFDRAFIAPYTLPFTVFGSLDVCGKGLRMSFDLMVSLSGVERVVVRNRGLVLVGLCTALVPMNIITESPRVVQWHLLESKDDGGNSFRYMHNREGFWDNQVLANRLVESDLEKLKGVAYVGWHSSVVMTLGTSNPSRLPRSSALPLLHSRMIKSQDGVQGGVQVGIPGGVSLNVNAVRNRGRFSAALRYSPSPHFSRRIEALYRGTVFVYDESEKIAWMCSMIDLIMFMLRLNQLHIDCPVQVPFKAREATRAEHNKSMKDLKGKKLESKVIPDSGGLTYGELIVDLSNQYDQLFGALKELSRERSNDTLVGFDIRDIVFQKPGSTFWPKELRVSEGVDAWSALVGSNDIVFCNGFDKAIIPRATQICQFSQQPPIGKNILACPIYLLKMFMEDVPCNIQDKSVTIPERYTWYFQGTPFACPKHSGLRCSEQNCWVNRLQHVIPRDTLTGKIVNKVGRGRTSEPCAISLEGGGAICFGFYNTN